MKAANFTPPGDDHDFEPAYGLPEILPARERMLWQGSPDWKRMTRSALHVRGLAVYFAVLIAWRGANTLAGGGGALDALAAMAWLLPLATLAIGTLVGLGWLTARTSVYTVTDRRVVMRVGIVLTVTFNLPYSAIDAASLHPNADGTGDIALALNNDAQIAYVHLWPHARPWHLKRTQPMLRALPRAREVAALLAGALAASAGIPRRGLHAVAPAPGARETAEAAPEPMTA
ncbi:MULTISPECIES: photosynthetic complex putative assembly protein PuhB [unclassified Variovorax]|uniref:photosynthetic complex putative assembly protein PuhB n=1 Tax=unclassified Variovorax TaxID=663243 RepID=UPI003F47A2EA